MAASLALFGKLPAHGDFVRRGDPALALRLEAWLADEVDRQFAAEGVVPEPNGRWFIGGDGVVGAIVASRDGVGRTFPLAAVAIGPGTPARLVAEMAEARDAGEDADALHRRLLAAVDDPIDGSPHDSVDLMESPDQEDSAGWPDEAAVERFRTLVANAWA